MTLEAFVRIRQTMTGHCLRCRECRACRARERYQTDPLERAPEGARGAESCQETRRAAQSQGVAADLSGSFVSYGASVLDIDLAVGSRPEIRATDTHVLVTFRGTSDRCSGDRDTLIRMSLPTRLALELGEQVIAPAGGYKVPAAPS